jgi:hypothetical protein
MRSKYYLADRLPGYLINLSLLNDRYWAASLPRASTTFDQASSALLFDAGWQPALPGSAELVRFLILSAGEN